ncbi:MAG: Sua5/YciO/YrdC/YwlC family protein, partial [Nanoarchaeota archaeon]
MQTLSKDEFDVKKDILLIKIKQGALFIHPTDTIYGIGCNAKNNDAVSKIREIKKQHTSPFSIIAPSKDWIIENCEIKDEHKIWLDKLPGPYTLILRLRNKEAIAANVNLNIDTVGIRIPDHWFSKVVEKLN